MHPKGKSCSPRHAVEEAFQLLVLLIDPEGNMDQSLAGPGKSGCCCAIHAAAAAAAVAAAAAAAVAAAAAAAAAAAVAAGW